MAQTPVVTEWDPRAVGGRYEAAGQDAIGEIGRDNLEGTRTPEYCSRRGEGRLPKSVRPALLPLQP